MQLKKKNKQPADAGHCR